MITTPHLPDVERYNRGFYERCWQAASLLPMPGIDSPPKVGGLQVEIGCGLRPRLPLTDAVFVDISPTACAKLQRAGARVICASLHALPLAAGSVSQLYLFDILEHLSDDVAVMRELARVSAANACLVLSTPLHAHHWHDYDRIVGHVRRYEPRALIDLLGACGFTLTGFAPFGMRPRNSFLTRLGAYYMVHWPRTAFWWQEQFLRWLPQAGQPVRLQPADADEFFAQIGDADGAVTAWRYR